MASHFSPSRTALGVCRPGPCAFALELLLVKALADPAKALGSRLAHLASR
jgi:hypothetical protein